MKSKKNNSIPLQILGLTILLFTLIATNKLLPTINIGYGVTVKNHTDKSITAYVESESKIVKNINIIQPGKEKFLPSASGPREIKWKIFINNEIFLSYKTIEKYEHPHIITISGQYGEKYQMTEKNSKQIEHKLEAAIWQADVIVKNFSKKPISITIGSNQLKVEPGKDNDKPGSGLLGVASTKPIIPTWTIEGETYGPKDSYDLVKFISIENNGKEFTIEGRRDGLGEIKIYHGNASNKKSEQDPKSSYQPEIRKSVGSQPYTK